MFNRFIDRFIHPKDKSDPETYMMGRYFVMSFFVLFILCLGVIPYYLLAPQQFARNPEAFYANVSFTFITLGIVLAYRKWGLRVVWVNLMAVLGCGGVSGTYETTGGIWSTDHVWGMVMAAWVFLVAGRIAGTFWMLVAVIQVIFFYYAETHHWKDFAADAIAMTPTFPLFNLSACAVFILAIIWLYDNARVQFVNELKRSNREVESQKKELETQKEDILSSIAYAKKIQEAILPHEEIVTRGIPLSFLLYKPRDIVSGDFYWFHEIDRDNYIFICGDCTGHGVPGAFMTVIGSNLLSQIIKENKISSPAKILYELDQRINETLKQDNARYSEVQDGMDLSIINVNKLNRKLVFSSAKRPGFFIRNNELRELKGSKLSIGGMRSGTKSFEETVIPYHDDDVLYLFTDGYIDQFGGPENKKFMIKRFRELVMSVHQRPMPEQKRKLDENIREWIGLNEQTDDILVCGIRF